MSANTLFISETTLKSRTAISDAIDGKQLKPIIKVAQDMYIMPALGSTLYKRLQDGIDGDNLNNAEKTLLNDYITDSLIWFTVSLMPVHLGYQFFSKGVFQKTSEESNTPSRGEIDLLIAGYKSQGEFYKTRMIQYLKENYQSYYQYLNTGSGLDVVLPETKGYTCPIYLGGYNNNYERRGLNGSGSGSDGTQVIEVVPIAGVSSFTVSQLSGKTLLVATRGGWIKGVVQTATTNTDYLQINGTTVTLPTGDITQPNELFTFLFK